MGKSSRYNVTKCVYVHFSLFLFISFPFRWKSFSQLCFKILSKEDATVIFRDAALYNMTDAGHVWIVTEQALFSNNTPVGTLGLKLNNDNETEHIRVRLKRILFFEIDLLARLNHDYSNEELLIVSWKVLNYLEAPSTAMKLLSRCLQNIIERE